jgi:2-iminobutanoate/2-iminopropanoate deaminase
MDAEELLERYAKGERQFHSAMLRGVDLKGLKWDRLKLCKLDSSRIE